MFVHRLAILGTATFALTLLAGCGTSVTSSKLNSPPHRLTRRAPATVEVFRTKAPDRAYTEVHMIEAQQDSGYSTDGQGEIVEAMRKKAGALGCDGLIVTGANDKTVVSGGNNTGVTSATLKGYRGVCIVYNEPR